MMLSVARVSQLLGVEAPSAASTDITGICADSRHVEPGQLFVALRGVVQDGHDHVASALDAGATSAVVADDWDAGAIPEDRLWRVKSTLLAYQLLAGHHRRAFGGAVVGVTGSVGKTTTKELIVSALSTNGRVLATPGNFNNEVGVPQTLLRLDPSYRYAVLEMGMRGPGQIAELAVVAQPEVAVITNVGTAHIGLLGSREAIARAKCELLEHVAPAGLAVLHHEPLLLETARSVYEGRTVSFGLGAGDLQGRLEPGDRLLVEGTRFDLPLPGAHHALALLATLAVARELGVPWSELKQLRLELPPGRGRRVEREGIILLDETYNAGPESMKAALQLLAAESCTRRIAVLGTMLELGDHGPELHRDVGEAVSALGIDALLVLGDTPEAEALLQGARSVACSRFSSHEALVAHLREMLRSGDAVLFKASRSIGLDRVVAALEGTATK